MKGIKVRDLDDQEINNQLKEIDEQLFRLKFQMSMGQTDGLKKFRQIKRQRSQMLTIRRERELAAARPAGEKK
jgi:large subunit ribosomal protein L29